MNNGNNEIQECQILDSLRPKYNIKATDNLRERVNMALNHRKEHKLMRWIVGGISSAAAAVIAVILTASPRISAKEIIRDALVFIENSFVVEFEARTLPAENFAYFDKNLPFTPITLSVSGKEWKIDKGGRMAMGNDSARYMWLPEYRTGWLTHKPKPNFIEDFHKVLNPRQLLTDAISIPENETNVRSDGNIITITSSKDNLIYTYIFDKDSHRLLSYNMTDGDKLLLRTTKISYTTSKQQLTSVPDGINWMDVSEMKGAFKGLSAKETAQIALTALNDCQSDIISEAFAHCAYDIEQFKMIYSGAALLNVGEPQQRAIPCKFFVPYRLRLKGGVIQSGILSLERLADGSWIIDGGI